MSDMKNHLINGLSTAGALAALMTPLNYYSEERQKPRRSSLSNTKHEKRKKKNKAAKAARKRNRK